MAQEGRSVVLFLGRDRFYLYDGGEILALQFPANLVHDLEVKDRNGLYNLVTVFIQNNKLTPAQIYFVLSESVCFSKDLPDEAGANEFIDTIPFSAVVSKTYKTANAVRVVGSNQDLIDTIFNAFEDKGFGVSALVPANIFPDIGVATELTPAGAVSVLGKKDEIVAASMVGERVVKEQELATSQTAVPKNKLLPYLIAGFVVLLVVLVVLIVTRK